MNSRTVVERLRGVIPALPTPFTGDGNVDEKGLENLVAHVLRGGVHGLWALGSSGEFPALAPAERSHVIAGIVQAAAGRVPVLVGLGSNDIRAILRGAEEAERAGADACFVPFPYYFVLDTDEAAAFLLRIGEESPLPVIIYDNPYATKTKLDPEVFLNVAGCRNIIAFKDSSSDFVRFQNLLLCLRAGTGWKLLQGDERLAGPSILWGADGIVAALASVAPSLFVRIFEAARDHNVEETFCLQKQALSLGKLFELKGHATDGAFFAGMKAALEVLGLCGRAVSSPFSPMPDDKMREVEELLKKCSVTQ